MTRVTTDNANISPTVTTAATNTENNSISSANSQVSRDSYLENFRTRYIDEGIIPSINLENLNRYNFAIAPSVLTDPRAGERRIVEDWDILSEFESPENSARRTNSVTDFVNPVGILLGKRSYQSDKKEAIVGLELENEMDRDCSLPRVKGWNLHNEGSLRNFGYEYVLNPPRPLKDIKRTLYHLLSRIKEAENYNEPLNSIRTSTHIHFDITKYTIVDAINFFAVYWVLEEFLSSYCGDTRKGNLFCLRMKDAMYIQSDLINNIKNRRPLAAMSFDNNFRYAGLNLASVYKFGSAEFRMMRGSADPEEIMTWVHALEAIRQFALNYSNPAELYKDFIENIPAEKFAEVVFSKDLAKRLNKRGIPKEIIGKEIREGFLGVHGLITAHDTWDFTKEIKELNLKKEKERKDTPPPQPINTEESIDELGPDEQDDQDDQAFSSDYIPFFFDNTTEA